MTTPVSRTSTQSPPVAVDGMLSLAPAIASTSTPAGMVSRNVSPARLSTGDSGTWRLSSPYVLQVEARTRATTGGRP